MEYRTIGITGTDLLFLSLPDRERFFNYVHKMDTTDVLIMRYELQYTKSTIEYMLEKGILSKDEDTEDFKNLYSQVKSLIADEQPDELDDDILFVETTSEFDTLFEDLVDEVEESDKEIHEDLLESKSEWLHDVLFENSTSMRLTDSVEDTNYLNSLRSDYNKLPVKYLGELKENELSKYLVRYICFLGSLLDDLDEINTILFRNTNKFSINIGYPKNYKFDTPSRIRSLVAKTKDDLSKGEPVKLVQMLFYLNNLIADDEQTISVPQSSKDELDLLIDSHYQNISRSGISPNLYTRMQYYYDMILRIKKSKTDKIFDGDTFCYEANYDKLALELSGKGEQARDFGIRGVLPYIDNIFLLNRYYLPSLDTEDDRKYSVIEMSNLTVIRNAIYSNQRFKSRR